MLTPFLLLMIIGMAGTGCKSSKQIQTVMQGPDTASAAIKPVPAIDSAAVVATINDRITNYQINFEWFASKIKVDYTDIYKKNTNANAFIKIKKNELIWVSLTGALGIEGFRAILTPDSVILMDKLEKTVSRRSISSISEIINLPVNFYAVQDLIMGNVVFFDKGVSSYRYVDGNLLALSIGEYFKHLLTVDTTANKLISSKLDDIDETRNRTAFIKFDGYDQSAGVNFSTVREISVAEKSKLDIKLEFKQFEFNTPQSFPFNIPKSYREK